MQINEAVDVVEVMRSSWLMIAKTLKGYVVYQEHPAFNMDDRKVPRPLYVFETKRALVEWLAEKWVPETPEHKLRCE